MKFFQYKDGTAQQFGERKRKYWRRGGEETKEAEKERGGKVRYLSVPCRILIVWFCLVVCLPRLGYYALSVLMMMIIIIFLKISTKCDG